VGDEVTMFDGNRDINGFTTFYEAFANPQAGGKRKRRRFSKKSKRKSISRSNKSNRNKSKSKRKQHGGIWPFDGSNNNTQENNTQENNTQPAFDPLNQTQLWPDKSAENQEKPWYQFWGGRKRSSRGHSMRSRHGRSSKRSNGKRGTRRR
jgi:hypothetical protein